MKKTKESGWYEVKIKQVHKIPKAFLRMTDLCFNFKKMDLGYHRR